METATNVFALLRDETLMPRRLGNFAITHNNTLYKICSCFFKVAYAFR
jgi:hypothetical protein